MKLKDLFTRNPEYFLLAGLAVFLTVISLFSPGYYQGADNINHYFLSRYAFLYPDKFLNPWGRPLYTILSSPFAQFGFQGIKLFNVLLGLLTAWFAFLLTKRLKMPVPWLVILLSIFTPLYCIMLFTAMTEILSGFVLILAIWFFFDKRYIASAVVISFIPFARSETFLFFPLFILAYILRKHYKPIPFLLAGFLFFCLIGAYQYHDFFWPVTHFPYGSVHDEYQPEGKFMQFFNEWDEIWGLPILILLATGIIALVYKLFSRNNDSRVDTFLEILLLPASALIYFSFHTYVFWQGIGGSIGLIRVLAAILPATCLVSMRGFQFMYDRIPGKPIFKSAFLIVTVISVLGVNFTTNRYPVPLGQEEAILKQVTDWVKKSPYAGNFIYYTDFNVPFFLGLDPFNHNRSYQKYRAHDLDYMLDSSLFLWDAHFGPNECQIPFDSIRNNHRFRLLQLAKPAELSYTYGGYPYEALLFLKLPEGQTSNYDSIREILELENMTLLKEWKYDFEKPGSQGTSAHPTDSSFSGLSAFRFDGSNEFSPGPACKLDFLPDRPVQLFVKTSVYINTPDSFPERAASLVISLENNEGSYFYNSRYFNKPPVTPGKWQPVVVSVTTPKIKSKEDYLKVYIWNPGKQKFLVDDLTISLYISKGIK
jgi:hypothetical protein